MEYKQDYGSVHTLSHQKLQQTFPAVEDKDLHPIAVGLAFRIHGVYQHPIIS